MKTNDRTSTFTNIFITKQQKITSVTFYKHTNDLEHNKIYRNKSNINPDCLHGFSYVTLESSLFLFTSGRMSLHLPCTCLFTSVQC